jgi:xanthine dehydrogenase iron-sulfur cluster and FAD-binding subunit A
MSLVVGLQVGNTRNVDVKLSLWVNGATQCLAVDSRTAVLDALREHLGAAGPHQDCDHGQCGTRPVLVDGRPVISCRALDALACTLGPAEERRIAVATARVARSLKGQNS